MAIRKTRIIRNGGSLTRKLQQSSVVSSNYVWKEKGLHRLRIYWLRIRCLFQVHTIFRRDAIRLVRIPMILIDGTRQQLFTSWSSVCTLAAPLTSAPTPIPSGIKQSADPLTKRFLFSLIRIRRLFPRRNLIECKSFESSDTDIRKPERPTCFLALFFVETAKSGCTSAHPPNSNPRKISLPAPPTERTTPNAAVTIFVL